MYTRSDAAIILRWLENFRNKNNFVRNLVKDTKKRKHMSFKDNTVDFIVIVVNRYSRRKILGSGHLVVWVKMSPYFQKIQSRNYQHSKSVMDNKQLNLIYRKVNK